VHLCGGNGWAVSFAKLSVVRKRSFGWQELHLCFYRHTIRALHRWLTQFLVVGKWKGGRD